MRRYMGFLLLFCSLGLATVVAVGAQDAKPQPSALVEAAGKGDLKAVSVLLAKGADPNAADSTDMRPLMAAIMGGKIEIVRALLEKGASINAVEGWTKSTPLHLAASEGNVQIILLLLKKGAGGDSRDFIGGTPLMMAAMAGKQEAAKLFLQKRANVNARHDETRREYFRAQFSGDTTTMKRLEESGALKKRHENGPSVLDWAEFSENKKLMALLKKAGAKTGAELDRERAAGK